jgi:hypothetical protein
VRRSVGSTPHTGLLLAQRAQVGRVDRVLVGAGDDHLHVGARGAQDADHGHRAVLALDGPQPAGQETPGSAGFGMPSDNRRSVPLAARRRAERGTTSILPTASGTRSSTSRAAAGDGANTRCARRTTSHDEGAALLVEHVVVQVLTAQRHHPRRAQAEQLLAGAGRVVRVHDDRAGSGRACLRAIA